MSKKKKTAVKPVKLVKTSSSTPHGQIIIYALISHSAISLQFS